MFRATMIWELWERYSTAPASFHGCECEPVATWVEANAQLACLQQLMQLHQSDLDRKTHYLHLIKYEVEEVGVE